MELIIRLELSESGTPLTVGVMEKIRRCDHAQHRLNVFESFNPKLPEAYENTEYLFLATFTSLYSCKHRKPNPKLIALDTMNLINTTNDLLKQQSKRISLLTNKKHLCFMKKFANAVENFWKWGQTEL